MMAMMMANVSWCHSLSEDCDVNRANQNTKDTLVNIIPSRYLIFTDHFLCVLLKDVESNTTSTCNV